MRDHTITYNSIFRAGLALLMALALLLGIALPATAAQTAGSSEPHRFAGNSTGISLPFDQTWSGGGSRRATYSLTPLGPTVADPGKDLNTASDVAAGKISWTVDGSSEQNPATFSLRGETTSHISFTWTAPGLYLFDLAVTSPNGNGNAYDRTVYRIRVYVRDVDQDYFVTAERNPTNETGVGGDKVAEITFAHSYRAPSDGGDGDNTPPPNNGGDTTPVTPTTPTTPADTDADPGVANIEESGNDGGLIEDIIGQITEWGNQNGTGRYDADPDANGRRIGTTGDDSRMLLYGGIALVAAGIIILWYVKRRKESI